VSLSASRRIRPEEYLAFEQASAGKHEFVDGVVYPWGDPDHPLDPEIVLGRRPAPLTDMAGGTRAHSAIKVNLIAGLAGRMRDMPCRVYDSDVRFRPEEDTYFYPDLLVVCGEQRRADAGLEVNNPTVVFEVLSPSTERIDRILKLRRYTHAPSPREYVLINTRFPEVVVYRLEEDRWIAFTYGQDETVRLQSISVDLELSEIYRDVEWDTEHLD
jgi:Uma2 family endonuclease